MDVALEPLGLMRYCVQNIVSILVLVDVALERTYPKPSHAQCKVSILVLVDVALEQVTRDNAGNHKGFNPCFSGCCS